MNGQSGSMLQVNFDEDFGNDIDLLLEELEVDLDVAEDMPKQMEPKDSVNGALS